jgi:endo-1,4-beta-xylanase
MEITRRQGLAMGISLAVAGCVGNGPLPETTGAAPSDGSLKALAKSKGMRFGSTLSSGNAQSGSFRNPRYSALLEQECSILVPENEMKWQSIRPGPAAFDFTAFDAQLDYAKAKGLEMRGHTLLWHRPEWMPSWLESYDFGTLPASNALQLLTAHIHKVIGHVGGQVTSFDVVNETIMPDTGLLSETALSRAFGSSQGLVDMAFHTARNAAPNAQLVYNDYMSWEPGNELHRKGVLKLLEGFRARGVPVDALGIQSHIRIDTYDPKTGTGPRQEREWRKFLDEVTGMGYKLLITEFDVNDQALPGDIASRDQSVADYARAYLDIMFSYPQLRDVLMWGMCDSYSWLQSFQPLRNDGLAKRSCPYDENFAPKPLRSAIASALLAAPIR